MAQQLFDDVDVSNALFALGRFIDYRLEEGMQEDWLHPYMQSYLNLHYRFRGQASPDLHELRARKVDVGPAQQAFLSVMTPAWLPVAEKLRHHHPELDSGPSTCGQGSEGVSESPAAAPALVSS
jgi:hypothetical protein